MFIQQLKLSLLALLILVSFLLIVLLASSYVNAEEIVVSPPENAVQITPPCKGMSSVSDTVHFEGNRWLQVCTNGSSLSGFILDYGTSSYGKLFSLEAENGVYFQHPRVAVMQAGGIVVLWNQTTDLFRISADTPIYLASFGYDGKQISPARNIETELNR